MFFKIISFWLQELSAKLNSKHTQHSEFSKHFLLVITDLLLDDRHSDDAIENFFWKNAKKAWKLQVIYFRLGVEMLEKSSNNENSSRDVLLQT